MLSTVFTVQIAYNFLVVVVTVVLVTETAVVVVVAAVMEVAQGVVKEEEVVGMICAGRTHEMQRLVMFIINVKTQERKIKLLRYVIS
jgi:hypothetical protein